MKNNTTIRKRGIIVALLTVCLCALALFMVFSNREPTNTVYADTVDRSISDLSFSLNNEETEYSVYVGNRNLESAIIPESYNGLPVTEIEENGFAMCMNLNYIYVPKSIIRIGRNAFVNCRSLVSVKGMSNVQEIGDAAFAGCVKLYNLILPSSAKNKGDNMIRGVTNPVYVRTGNVMPLSDENWRNGSTAEVFYGNDLACSPMTNEDGEIIGYSVDEYQNFYYEDGEAELVCSYKHEADGTLYPILKFSKDSFLFSYVYNLTIKADENIGTYYKIKFEDNALSNYYIKTINIEIDAEYGDGVFANCVNLESIISKSNVSVINDKMFESNENLQTIKFGENSINDLQGVTRIGKCAFDKCFSLLELNVPDSCKIIDEKAFRNMGQSKRQTIKFNVQRPSEGWHEKWDSEVGNYLNLDFLPTNIHLKFNNDVDEFIDIEVYYGKPMPDVSDDRAKNLNGYFLVGYYTKPNGEGMQYYSTAMNSVRKFDLYEGDILYAYWRAVSYQITYQVQGWSGIIPLINPTSYTIEDEITIVDILLSEVSPVYTYYVIKWDVKKINKGTKGNITITGKIYADLSNFQGLGTDAMVYDFTIESYQEIYVALPNTSVKCNLIIDPAVNHVSIEGHNTIHTLSITATNRLIRPFTLSLSNITIMAPRGRDAIVLDEDYGELMSGTLFLYTYGNVSIIGGQGGSIIGDVTSSNCDGHYAIKCKSLQICSADNLLIQGGKGADGVPMGYHNGGRGGDAIYLKNNYLLIECDNVTIRGGNGGDDAGSDYIGSTRAGEGGKPVFCAGTADIVMPSWATNIHFYDGEKGESRPIGGYPNPDPFPYPNPDPYPIV